MALPDKTARYNMLLSATMFWNMIYEIDGIHHRFNVSVHENDCVRRLVAHYDEHRDKLYVHYNT